MAHDFNHIEEIIRRIRIRWIAFGRYFYMRNSSLNCCISPVFTSGAETWWFTRSVQLKLRTNQRAMERKMVAVTLRDKKRAERIIEQTRVKDIFVEIKKKKWVWAGHVLRWKENPWSLTEQRESIQQASVAGGGRTLGELMRLRSLQR